MLHQLWHRLLSHRGNHKLIDDLFTEYPFKESEDNDGNKILEYIGDAADLGLSLEDISADGPTFIGLPRSEELKNRIREVVEQEKRAMRRLKAKGIPDDEIEYAVHFGGDDDLIATEMESEDPTDEVEYDEEAVFEEGDGDDDDDDDDEEGGGEMDVDQGGAFDDEDEMMEVDADFDADRDAWFHKYYTEVMETDALNLPWDSEILNLPREQQNVFWEMWDSKFEAALDEAARAEAEQEAAREEEAGQDAPAQLMEVDQEEAEEEGDAEGEEGDNVRRMTTAVAMAGTGVFRTSHVASQQSSLPMWRTPKRSS